jgi:hypothetical protein
MTDPGVRALIGATVPERDGAACGRTEVAVAWGLVFVIATTFACLTIAAQLPIPLP